MLDLSVHKGIGVLLESTQASPRAKVNPFTVIHGTRIIRGVFQFAAAGSFVFRWRSDGSLSQISFILFARMIF